MFICSHEVDRFFMQYQDQEGKNKDEENKTKFIKNAGTYANQFADWSTQAKQEQQRSCPETQSEHYLLRDWEVGQRCQ